MVEDQEAASFRVNSLIYSGIFNSRTGINNSNVFSVAEDITKSADPANGSIQRLYAEDSNLIIFQEEKVSRALIDKDAIYNAEGGGAVTSSNLVIGTIQPYAGEYGISKNPESFAVYGYQKYFADKNNNAILRLSNNGITEISAYGMKDFFRDKLNEIDSASFSGVIKGGYDIHNSQYVASMQTNPVFQQTDQEDTWNTLSFDETVNGWPSLYSYKPEQIFSVQNNFYTVYGGKLYRHYANFEPDGTAVKRSNFYGVQYPSTISFVVNDNPANSKSFQTISYEGTNGWQVSSYRSDSTGEKYINNLWRNSFDQTTGIKSYYEGEYVISESTGISNQSSITTTINLNDVTGLIPVGALVTGAGIPNNTTVVSFSPSSSSVVVNQNVNVAQFVLLNFYIVVDRISYNTAFNTTDPALPRYHAGFDLKENKYVANLINTSNPTEGEIIFGNQISGIKGFYANVKLSTDNTTNLGGEKQLFNVSTTYTQNNGY